MPSRTAPASGPSIAVIVPNRNDARHLPRCLRSVLDQEVPPDELIVVDDASTDDSVAIIESLIRGNPRARLLANPVNLGINRTINESLARVNSDYVLPLSANDFVLPGIFARAKAGLARLPRPGLWSAMAWLVDEGNRVIRLHASPVISLEDSIQTPEMCVRLAHRVGHWFTGPTVIYRLDALKAAGGFDPSFRGAADTIAALVIASHHGAAYSPEPFGAFRIHAGSYSSATLSDLARLDAALDYLAQRGPELSPRLFGSRFVEHTALRYRFAAVRESGGAVISTVAGKLAGWRRRGLEIIDRLTPGNFSTLRVALAFLVLRPFDLWPTLVNRLFGWAIVRARLGLRRKSAS